MPIKKTEDAVSSAIKNLLELYEKRGLLVWTRTNSGIVQASVSRGYGNVPAKRFIHLCRTWWPDLTVILKGGMFLGIEVKSSVGKQGVDQKEMEEKISSLGALYIVARSADEVKQYIDAHLSGL